MDSGHLLFCIYLFLSIVTIVTIGIVTSVTIGQFPMLLQGHPKKSGLLENAMDSKREGACTLKDC